MLIVFTLLFKSSNESTAWHFTELIIDHAYHVLAVTIKKSSLHMPFQTYFQKFP